MSTPAPGVSKEAHRLNEIEARKAWVRMVQIYCASMHKRIRKLVTGPKQS